MIWPWRENNNAALPGTPGENTRGDEMRTVLQAVLATIPDAMLIVDRRGEVLMANARADELLGADNIGNHLTASIRSPALLNAFDSAVQTGQPVNCSFERRKQVESTFEASITPVALSSDNADTPMIFILLRDLSAHQRIEKMRADFVANASHELRTPLTTLFGFIETLQGAAKNDAKARGKFLDLMRYQAERMRRLIDDLLSLSRVEMNAHHHPAEEVDFSNLVQHICETLTGLARDNDVELRCEVDPGLRLAGDRDELGQAVENLIENAIKYGCSGKFVDICAKHSGVAPETMVSLSVRDYGLGIDAQHLPRLTERFYRVNEQESRARGGTGLGLAIVKHIVNRHRGHMEIDSEPGSGSVFSLHLPVGEINKTP